MFARVTPAQLAEILEIRNGIVARNRALFGGYQMMADGGGDSAGDGGSGNGGQGGGDGGQDGQQGSEGQDGDGGKDGQQGKQDAPPADETPEQQIARLTGEIGKLRRENGSQRVTAKQKAADEAKAELAQTIGKALGIVKDDQPVDPDVLQQQIAAAQTQARQSQVQLAVYRAAGKHSGDPDALLDSNAFLAKVNQLDPTAGDFDTKVGDEIKAAVAANPRMKAQAAGRGGAEMNGGSREGGTRQPKSLDQAVGAHYGG